MLYLFQSKYCDILGNCLICHDLDEKLNTTFICGLYNYGTTARRQLAHSFPAEVEQREQPAQRCLICRCKDDERVVRSNCFKGLTGQVKCIYFYHVLILALDLANHENGSDDSSVLAREGKMSSFFFSHKTGRNNQILKETMDSSTWFDHYFTL